MRAAVDVARRCLCLELLFQRYLLEIAADEPAPERERARAMWLSREADLGIADVLAPSERTLLVSPVGELSEADLDELHGRAIGAAVLSWALGRAPERPTFASAESVGAEHGLLGDGFSIRRAREASEAASLRAENELDSGLATYLRVRGKAREVDDPERIFAGVAAHHLTWVLDPVMAFDDDIELD